MNLPVSLAALLLAVAPCGSVAAELRGAWLARDSFASRASIGRAMDALAAANFNAAFVDVWSRGYPAWPSAVFERETGISGDPGFTGRDIVQEAVEEGRRSGIHVVAWFEYGFIGGWSGYFPGRGGRGPIFDAHPEWLARTASGLDAFTAPSGFFFWMAHARPDVQQFLIALATELVERYPVAGVQFDRVRYPQTDCGYDGFTRELYAQEHGGAEPPVNANDPAWMRWRADQLNAFVAELYRGLKQTRPWLAVSNAPAVFPLAYTTFLQDYPAWLRQGSLDYVVPQVYRRTEAEFRAELDRQLSSVPVPAAVVPGVDITNSRNPDELARQIETTRARGLPGVVVWYQVALEGTGAFDVLRRSVFAEPAGMPAPAPLLPLPPRSRQWP